MICIGKKNSANFQVHINVFDAKGLPEDSEQENWKLFEYSFIPLHHWVSY